VQLTLLSAKVVLPPVQLLQVGWVMVKPPGDMEPARHALHAGGVAPGVTSLPAGQAANNRRSSSSSSRSSSSSDKLSCTALLQQAVHDLSLLAVSDKLVLKQETS
jgi:hypothetical protein